MRIWSFWSNTVSGMSQLKYNLTCLIFKHTVSVVHEKEREENFVM